jgi:uncharacterized peroxidase-related enzyme
MEGFGSELSFLTLIGLMPHIDLPDGVPGIRGPLNKYPVTAKPLLELAQTLLRGDSTLSAGQRELIATFVSNRNECAFCAGSHGAAAKHLLDSDFDLIEQVWAGPDNAPVSDKLKALLRIAGQVQKSGRDVTDAAVAEARDEGATDKEIHDTVLIASAFCMYNRYVDGLDTIASSDLSDYDEMGAMMAEEGYTRVRS